MIIAGVVLIAIAAGALAYARHARRSARRLTATETLACGDIATLAQTVAGEVGGGSFSQRCEVVGAAEPGPGGPLQAPESGAEVVWHRTKVSHRYWRMESVTRDGKTVRERREHTDVVSEVTSSAPFAVRDASGTVLVAPEGADIDDPEHVVDRFDRGGADGGPGGVADALVGALLSGGDSGTIGFQHEEWVLRPGARLYVHGEVSDATGGLTFARPGDGGSFVVSTRSEEQMVKGKETAARLATLGGAAAAVIGLVLIAAGAAG